MPGVIPDPQGGGYAREPHNADRSGYRLLADAVIAHLDVRDGADTELALCVEAVERAASPCLSEAERWQVEEARGLLCRWDSSHGPGIYGAERTLADQLRGMLALVDQLAPRGPGTG